MKKKLIGVMASTGIAIAACSAPANLPIHLLHARADGADCTAATDTLYKSRALLDLSGSASYQQVFSWENTLEPILTVVGSDTIADATRATFYARQAQMTYVSTGGVHLPPATWNFAASLPAGSTGQTSDVGIELFPSPIPTDLLAAIPAGGATLINPVEVDVTLTVVGTVGGTPTQTNSLTFPVSVLNSGVVCKRYLGGPCGQPGRDTIAQCDPDGGS